MSALASIAPPGISCFKPLRREFRTTSSVAAACVPNAVQLNYPRFAGGLRDLPAICCLQSSSLRRHLMSVRFRWHEVPPHPVLLPEGRRDAVAPSPLGE